MRNTTRREGRPILGRPLIAGTLPNGATPQRGGASGPVTGAVFKTVGPSFRGGRWVRPPCASAKHTHGAPTHRANLPLRAASPGTGSQAPTPSREGDAIGS